MKFRHQRRKNANDDTCHHYESEQLKQRFLGALKFLRSTKLRNNEKTALADLPWVLMLGDQGSGKTTLLANSGLRYLLAKQLKHKRPQDITATKQCDWWVTKQAVFLDVAGGFIDSENQQLTHKLWLDLLALLRKHVDKHAVKAIILTLSTNDLLTKTHAELRKQAERVRQRIYELNAELNIGLPIYLVISKCDQIKGFQAFFQDLSIEEQQQICGLHFSSDVVSEDNINVQYKIWLERINTRLLQRLHQEWDDKQRAAIQTFPLQLENLSPPLLAYLGGLISSVNRYSPNQLCGIYLTSSSQHDISIDTLLKPLARSFELPESSALSVVEEPSHQPFFIRRLLGHISQQSQHSHTPGQANTRSTVPLAALASCLLLSLAILVPGYISKLNTLNRARTALSEYHLLDSEQHASLIETIHALTALRSSQQQLRHASNPITRLLIGKQTTLAELSQQTYQQALQDRLLPSINEQLKQQLNSPSKHDAADLYLSLAINTMLQQPQHWQPSLLQHWLQTQADINLSTGDLQQLTQLLHDAADNHIKQTKYSTARLYLRSLPKPELALAVIKNQPAILNLPHKTSFDIPTIFSSAGLNAMTPALITSANRAAYQGDWVLGAKQAIINDDTLKAAAGQLVSFYAKQYVQHWQQAQSQLSLPKLDSLAAINQQLTGEHSLQHTIQALSHNAAIDASKIIAPNQAIAAFINEQLADTRTDTQTTTSLISALNDLQAYIQTLLDADDPNTQALTMASKRMRSTTEDAIDTLSHFNKAPTAINKLAQQLANSAWQQQLQLAQTAIDQQWQNDILPFYEKRIANRYPINTSSNDEITLADFQQFFGPDGMLAQLMTELSPFIDMRGGNWQPKQKNKLGLSIDTNTLNQLARATLIQHMFFDKNTVQVKFDLLPLALQPIIKQFNLTAGDQQLNFQHNVGALSHITWNTKHLLTPVHLNMTLLDGHSIQRDYNGPWALFRALQDAGIEPTTDPKSFLLNFDIDGNMAQYQLMTASEINPFAQHILDQFVCPLTLFGHTA